ncbi:MAG: hypothetical protein GY941_11510 [Planctomycetes bacterium]|nr:hypothetical protein [Planctomycetota bacterium]
MLIDWLTCKLDERHLSAETILKLRNQGDRIIRICIATGEQIYETQAWDSIRSDSHAISVRMGSDCFWVQGSPARVIESGCAVFGSGSSAKLDIGGCAAAMLQHVAKVITIDLPEVNYWKITRIDVTDNIAFKNEHDVQEALDILNRTDGGRYKVSNKAGNSIYWSSKSRIRKGKAYAKGEHLAYLMRKKGYTGIRYTDEKIELARRILRLELTIGSQYLRENVNHWSELTSEELARLHDDYFGRMIGDIEMTDNKTLEDKLIEVCPTKRQALAAFDFFSFIKANGLRAAKRRFSSRTFYRHQNHLKKAGLGDADISTGEIVALKRRVLDMQSVNSWEDIKIA